MAERTIPGTGIPYDGDGMFTVFRPLIAATDGLTLGQVSALTGLEGTTIQNWVKRGFVARPVGKKYRERQLARILLISALRDSLRIDDVGELMRLVNGSADDERDDIISEETLYDCFCAAAGRIDAPGDSPDAVERAVDDVMAGAGPLDGAARSRVRDALTVMALVHVSAAYKRAAEKKIREMKEGSS